MTQDVDGDLELSMQPDATPSSGGKGASKRGSNYSQEEDIQLCKSWISISFIWMELYLNLSCYLFEWSCIQVNHIFVMY